MSNIAHNSSPQLITPGHPDYTDNLHAVLNETRHQSQHPPSGDKVIAALMTAQSVILQYDSPIGDGLRRRVNNVPLLRAPLDAEGFPTSELVGQMRMGWQYDVIGHCGRQALSRYTDPQCWLNEAAHIERDKDRLTMLRFIMSNLVPTTNQVRWGPVEVVRQMGTAILGQEFATWEGGSSIPIGAKASQRKQEYPFAPSVFRQPAAIERDPYDEAQAAYHALLGGPAMQGDIICTDVFREGRALHEKLLIASRRPKEITDDQAHRRLMDIMHTTVPNVHLAQGDITDRTEMLALSKKFSHVHKRLGVLGTVLNELGQGEVHPTLRNAMEFLDDDGILLILDFAFVDDKGNVRLAPEWREYTYRMLVAHKQHPGRVDELIRFKSSRMDDPQLNPNGMIDWGDGRGLVPFVDQLIYAAGMM